MKNKNLLLIGAICLLVAATSVQAQEITQKSIDLRKKQDLMTVPDKVCDYLIKNWTIMPMKKDEQIIGALSNFFLNSFRIKERGEILSGKTFDGYKIITLNDTIDNGLLLFVSKDGVTCFFDSNGGIMSVEFSASLDWSIQQNAKIEGIRKYVNNTLLPLYK